MSTAGVEREYLTPPEVGRLLGVSADKVLRWITSGELPAVDLSTRRGPRPRWHVSRAAMETFLLRRQSQPAAPIARRKKKREKKLRFF